jgi:hypothetical protein
MRGGPEAARIADRQLQAAIAVAPYLHAKLAAVAVRQEPPPDPEREARAAAIRAELHAMMQLFAVPEPLVIGGEREARKASSTPGRRTTARAICPPDPFDWPR